MLDLIMNAMKYLCGFISLIFFIHSIKQKDIYYMIAFGVFAILGLK